ncbi:MAG: hypothetical protein ABW036_10875 [Flavitalea sp.]
MDSYINHVEKDISFKGGLRKIRISDVTHESGLPSHKPSIPIYSVEFSDEVLTKVMGEDRVQVILSDPPNFNDTKTQPNLATDEQNEVMKAINKAVIEHHEVFHPEGI